MKKVIFGISFYASAILAMVMVINNNSMFLSFLGLMIAFMLMSFAKAVGKDFMMEIIGINWLQKSFSANSVIMDMTRE